ncbi:MAG: molecular chaperone DnaJ [Gemmatimonadales bacterium]|nr:MAG: molecular chaperone DnaJ [Gemmatimonadales bacterium]
MTDEYEIDYYEVLQVSPKADQDTIERVFRHLAKRFHPDNGDSGDADRFSQISQAFRILSSPEERARYDAGYGQARRAQWKIFDQASATNNVESDRQIRLGLMTLLYQARRRDVDNPGMGIIDLERILDCPQDHMKFHLWYLKESGWVQRLDNGFYAITVEGIDELNRQEIPWAGRMHQLPATTEPEDEKVIRPSVATG